MTVSTLTNIAGPYPGNGVTVEFDFDFRVYEAAHLIVTRIEGLVRTVLVLDSDYTIVGLGDANGGYIYMLEVPEEGQDIEIVRTLPYTQSMDLENQGPYFAETIERAFDEAAMRDQQLDTRLAQREDDLDDFQDDVAAAAAAAASAAASAAAAFASEDVAEAAQAAAEAAQADAEAAAAAAAGVVAGAYQKATDNAADIRYLPGGTGAVTRNADAKLREAYVSVADYGATPNSSLVTNNHTAFNNAAYALSLLGGGTLFIPFGTWYLRQLVQLYSNIRVLLAPGAVVKCDVANFSGTNGIFRNVNHAASSLTDENIHLDGHGRLDATGMPGDTHMWYMRYVRRSSFLHAQGEGGGNVTSFLACKGTLTAYAKALNVGNCGFDHWDGPEDALVFDCEVDGSPAQGIQATACDTSLGVRHGKNIRFVNNRLRNITNVGRTAAALIFNTGNASATMRECVSEGNVIEDSDLGIVFEGLGEQRTSRGDRLVRVTGLPLFFHGNFGAPTDCRIIDPELIDCDHDPGNVAMIQITGSRNFVTGVKLRNSGAAAYDLVAYFVSGSSGNRVEIQTGGAGSSGYFSDAGSNAWAFKHPIITTVASLAGRGVTYDKPWATATATNGRKSAEGVGAGTGVPVYWDGTNWRTYYDNAVVAA